MADVAALEAEIDRLHAYCERHGLNSRGVSDIVGREFALPVDAEHKATVLQVTTAAQPHMRAFHLAWLGFFSTFFSTFAPAPLMPYIKPALGISKREAAVAGMASVGSTIFFRLIMGLVADTIGARRGMAACLLVTTLPILGMMYVQDATGFIVCRGLIGISLASFVACQAWVSVMFSKPIVGLANATAGGWGNLGGGITNLAMPFVFLAVRDSFAPGDDDAAWRLCFWLPALLHFGTGLATLTGRDLPDGNVDELELLGAKQKSRSDVVLKVGFSNLNGWLLCVLYGMSFGVELTVTNEAATYFFEYHGLSVKLAGALASCFGLMNLFARSLGGIASDWLGKRFGMPGRIWSLWISQALEGVFCCLLGLTTSGMALEEIPASNTAGRCVLLLSVFSIFVQMAEGGTYAIVPQVSRSALGVVSGIVGAGGNLGSVVTTAAFFASSDARTDDSFIKMGLAIVASSCLCALLYWPDEGGALLGPRALGRFNPQLVLPPEGYGGADVIDLSGFAKGAPATARSTVLSTVKLPESVSTASEYESSADAENGDGSKESAAAPAATQPSKLCSAELRSVLSSDAVEQALKGLALSPAELRHEDALDALRLESPGLSTDELRRRAMSAGGATDRSALELV